MCELLTFVSLRKLPNIDALIVIFLSLLASKLIGIFESYMNQFVRRTVCPARLVAARWKEPKMAQLVRLGNDLVA